MKINLCFLCLTLTFVSPLPPNNPYLAWYDVSNSERTQLSQIFMYIYIYIQITNIYKSPMSPSSSRYARTLCVCVSQSTSSIDIDRRRIALAHKVNNENNQVNKEKIERTKRTIIIDESIRFCAGVVYPVNTLGRARVLCRRRGGYTVRSGRRVLELGLLRDIKLHGAPRYERVPSPTRTRHARHLSKLFPLFYFVSSSS